MKRYLTDSTVISRTDAAAAGQKRFYTGKTCRAGHLAQRYTSSGACVACANPLIYGPTDEGEAWFPDPPLRLPRGVPTVYLAELRDRIQAIVCEVGSGMDTPPKGYRMADGQGSYGEYIDLGWTSAQMVKAGLLVPINAKPAVNPSA